MMKRFVLISFGESLGEGMKRQNTSVVQRRPHSGRFAKLATGYFGLPHVSRGFVAAQSDKVFCGGICSPNLSQGRGAGGAQ